MGDSRRYGPTFVRRGRVDMRKLNLGRISGLDVVGVEEPRIEALRDKTWDREKEAARDQYDRFQEQNKRAKKFMETQTQEEFLKLNKELMLERAAIMKGIYKGCRIPDFDLGYDTVERSMVCSKMSRDCGREGERGEIKKRLDSV